MALDLPGEAAVIDVHPPHGAVHGWRDFLIHISTITIGLFIALSLEAGVEGLHHRHLVREARENIRRELEQNEAETEKDIVYVQEDAERLKADDLLMSAFRTNPHAFEHQTMHFTFSWSSFNDSAWRSARDSGALTYMPTAEVQRYADNYGQQEIINTQAVEVFTRQTDVAGPLVLESGPEALDLNEQKAFLKETATAYIRLTTLKQLIEGLRKRLRRDAATVASKTNLGDS